MRYLGLLLAAMLSLPAYAGVGFADAQPPDQTQLLKLLSGNTMYGVWAGKSYQQYFNPNGSTRYLEEGAPEAQGNWEVNAKGQYCSVWPPAGRWVCYNVRVDGNQIFWQSGDDYFPSEIKAGKLF